MVKHKKEIQKKNDQEGRSKTLSLFANYVIVSTEIPQNLRNKFLRNKISSPSGPLLANKV